MDKKQAKLLLEKYNDGTASPEEVKLLENWYAEQSAIEWQNPEDEDYLRVKSEMWKNIKAHKVHTRSSYPWARVVTAASILLFLGFGFYFYRSNNKQHQNQEAFAPDDFEPGSNKAILTLGDGKKILVTGARNGQLALQGNTKINKTAEGQIIYNSGKSDNSAIVYNTMSTPQGGQYRLILSDGTGVWLNAASSIKYPTAFIGKDRRVEITGEVYFEVMHNPAKPFRVTSNGQTVEVLGTHFNINAYNNEPDIKTTLLQGSVKINTSSEEEIIKPGQQATVSHSKIGTKSVDIDEITAWKDGYFDFTDSDIKSIMRQLSRWYDVDIQFEGPVTNETFTGRIPRSWNLSQVMKIIQSSKSIHFTVEGRRIMIK
ncbi:FecR family protein [Pedobacter sp. L105]|uniref:FecR family protein n=1 Tax=Pedobacter sp. L105 TaxID=1641871 RepID=UPI00131D9274|nr:FecR family protein [Pedobacter sp. L105]